MQKREQGQPHKGWKKSAAKRHEAKPADNDESFASRAIQAQLDHAMGIENEDYDWLVEPYE